ncbi:unnamed protein product [Blepharisma stoltei]|uniref:Uncharacterized protein n=1 Tax=Blepharisma stoltei TaxID=1481888 RepID=A0AAU9JJ99_9CILI|nr:unnamed protein product [Blepharisma stoltei]
MTHKGFIWINFVKNIIKQLKISGKVERPYTGLSFTQAALGLAVIKVQPGSPTEKVGIRIAILWWWLMEKN